MSNSVRNYTEVILEIFTRLKDLLYFRDMSEEEFLESFSTPLREIFATGDSIFKDDQYYFCDVGNFFASMTPLKLQQLSCPHYRQFFKGSFISTLAVHLTKGQNTALFDNVLTVVLGYLLLCRLPGAIRPESLNEPKNYYITNSDTECIYDGEFEKIASTMFGGEEIPIFQLELPSDRDVILTYSREGILQSILSYKGGVFANI